MAVSGNFGSPKTICKNWKIPYKTIFIYIFHNDFRIIILTNVCHVYLSDIVVVYMYAVSDFNLDLFFLSRGEVINSSNFLTVNTLMRHNIHTLQNISVLDGFWSNLFYMIGYQQSKGNTSIETAPVGKFTKKHYPWWCWVMLP